MKNASRNIYIDRAVKDGTIRHHWKNPVTVMEVADALEVSRSAVIYWRGSNSLPKNPRIRREFLLLTGGFIKTKEDISPCEI